MDIFRMHMLYKCFGIERSKICNSDFYSNASISSIHTSSNGKYSYPFIFSKDGRYPQQSSFRCKQRDLVLLAGQRDHNYRRIPSRCSQQGNQFPVASSERLQRMEVGLQSFSINMQEMGASRHRSFCFQNFPSGSNIHVMEVGSIQKGKGCFSNNMDPSKRICLPPTPAFALIGQVLNKWQKEKATLLLITPAWQTQSWSPLLLQLTVRITLVLPKTQNLLLDPNREKHPLIEQGNLQLLVWTVSRKVYMHKEFWKTLPLLSQMPEDQV